MQCFVLGSGGMMPMPQRRLTSLALRHAGRVYLFDCGEGTQLPYKELHIGLRALTVVATTHLHADHVLGLPGLLMLRAQMPDPPPLTLLGVPGLRRFVEHVRADLAMFINYPIEVIEWSGDAQVPAYRDDEVTIYWQPLDHRVLCLGYRLEEHERPGRFDPGAATRLGVPCGPLWGQLQHGSEVVLPGGAVVRPAQVLGPPRRGRHVAFITDTAPCAGLRPLLRAVDLAFIEGMFAAAEQADADEKRHLTAVQAARAAREAEARRVVLVHVSPRYDATGAQALGAEAAAHHPRLEVARDGMLIELPLPD